MLENTDYYHLLCDGMTVYDVNIRARTFSTLCTGIGQSIAAMPPEIMNIALKLAHGFIMDNISVTSQAARHSIVRSVMFLLPAVRDFLAFGKQCITTNSKMRSHFMFSKLLRNHLVLLYLFIFILTSRFYSTGSIQYCFQNKCFAKSNLLNLKSTYNLLYSTLNFHFIPLLCFYFLIPLTCMSIT